MKLVYVIPGIILLVLAGALYTTPTALGTVTNFTGITGTKTLVNDNLLLNVDQGNYSYQSVTLGHSDRLAVSIQSDAPGVEFLLMNQGNFSTFESEPQTSVQIYNASRLNVTNYSFSFISNATGSENYYLVFKSLASGTNVDTNAIVNVKVLRPTSVFDVSYIPIAIGVVGVALMGVGMFQGGAGEEGEQKTASSSKSVQKAAAVATTKCKFCGKSIPAQAIFCPHCKKSQQ